MNQPLIHKRTQQHIERYLQKPSHGLLLSGAAGIGKTFLARWIGAQLDKEALVITGIEKGSITIEQIRELYTITKTGSSLIIILEDVDTMSPAAQNAFLKLLEEPPAGVSFILTARTPYGVLTTIRSRTQHIEVIAPEIAQFDQHVSNHPSLQALLHTAEAKPGKFFTLLAEEDQRTAHDTTVQQAKQFYAATPFKRHTHCITIGFEKAKIEALLATLAIIVQTLMKDAKQPAVNQKKLVSQAALIEEVATKILSQNGNPKIHMTKLCEEL